MGEVQDGIGCSIDGVVATVVLGGIGHIPGVVLGIAPWNAPVILGVRAVAVPLACGNTVVLKPSAEPGIYSSHLHADGSLSHILQVDGGIANGVLRGNPFVQMDGQAVYRTAVRVLAECAHEALSHSAMSVADVDWLVPHQANIRILNTTADKLGLPMDKVVTTVARQGNTSAASVPLALDAAVRDGRIKTGQMVLLVGVGAGMTWGSVLLRL